MLVWPANAHIVRMVQRALSSFMPGLFNTTRVHNSLAAPNTRTVITNTHLVAATPRMAPPLLICVHSTVHLAIRGATRHCRKLKAWWVGMRKNEAIPSKAQRAQREGQLCTAAHSAHPSITHKRFENARNLNASMASAIGIAMAYTMGSAIAVYDRLQHSARW